MLHNLLTVGYGIYMMRLYTDTHDQGTFVTRSSAMHDISPPAAAAGPATRSSGRYQRARLLMVGLDHKVADIATREAFSLADSQQGPFLQRLCAHPHISGCAYLSTCNRSELYLSHTGAPEFDAAPLLCEALGIDAAFKDCLLERAGASAVRHLMRVSGGMEASVPGDDQVISQVRAAIEAAREADSADPQLETLFRLAVTAGKRIRTKAPFSRDGDSVADAAVRSLAEHLGELQDRRALVIGNGIIGRLAAAALLSRSCSVAMTLRTHRPGRPAMPEGCDTIEFAERFAAMQQSDIVISATASPHFTVTREELEKLPKRPAVMVDLAIPRDIEPEAGSLSGVTLWNLDDLKQSNDGQSARRTLLAEEIIDEEAARFEMWRQNRQRHSRRQRGRPDFPAFINLHGRVALVVGGGKVAARRAEVLLNFGASVRLIAPVISEEAQRLLEREGLVWRQRAYKSSDLEGVTLAVAATDVREANQRIGQEAKEHGVLVSVADRREECSFYFPAIIRSENLTAGLVSNDGSRHDLVKKTAARLRGALDQIDEDYTGGKQGE